MLTSFELEPVVNRPDPEAFSVPLGLAPGRIHALASRAVDTGRKRPCVCESVRQDETINLELPVPTRHYAPSMEDRLYELLGVLNQPVYHLRMLLDGGAVTRGSSNC